MERAEVSQHEVRVAGILRDAAPRWLSNIEIASRLSGVALRTVRLHTHRLHLAGLVEEVAVFPGYRYRWSASEEEQRDHPYAQRLTRAAEALGLS